MIPKNNCIECNTLLWDENPPLQPRPGDVCNCAFCGCPMEFDDKLKLKKPSVITPAMREVSSIIKVLNKRK